MDTFALQNNMRKVSIVIATQTPDDYSRAEILCLLKTTDIQPR